MVDLSELKKELISFKSRWPLLQKELDNENLLPIDLLFAEHLLRFFPEAKEESAFLLAHLFAYSRQGHLCLPLSDPLFLKGLEMLSSFLKNEIEVVESRCYLRKNWEIEQLFIEHWRRIKCSEPKLVIPLQKIEEKMRDLPLQEEQKEAIRQASEKSISLICGGPGTGKTFTAATLITIFLEWIPDGIVIAAPTGKAAVNLREKLPSSCEVHTLHRAIKKKLFLSAKMILVDEGSMVDAKTMATLFSQVPHGTRLILIGDPFQLPPVESGNLFADLVVHSKSSLVELKKCLRAELKEIVQMAESVKRGEPIQFSPLPSVRTVVKMMIEKLKLEKEQKPEEIFAYYLRFRAFSPLRHGPYGVDTLNQQVFQIHCSLESDPWVPILIIENDSDRELFNGDVGILSFKKEIAVFKEGRSLPLYLLPRYELAYFLSVHKSQGSEYDEILLLIPEGAEKFGREILYTAITRARKKVAVFGDKNSLEVMLKKTTPRFSGLSSTN